MTATPRIRQLTKADTEAAGALLGRTFAAEAWARELLPDDAERLRFCTLLYTANTRWSFHRGSVWGIEADPGLLGGVLSLIDKPCPPMTAAEATTYGYDPVDDQWGELLAEFDALEAPATDALDSLPKPWTYINVLGVDPAHQGRGLGTALMQNAITHADATKKPMGLITDNHRDVRFYGRLGFTIVRKGSETAPIALWAMTRQSPTPVPPRSAP